MDGLTRSDVLRGLLEFDALGGASLELIAWEFNCQPADLREIWQQLIDAALIEIAGTDTVWEETMYVLTDTGMTAAQDDQ